MFGVTLLIDLRRFRYSRPMSLRSRDGRHVDGIFIPFLPNGISYDGKRAAAIISMDSPMGNTSSRVMQQLFLVATDEVRQKMCDRGLCRKGRKFRHYIGSVIKNSNYDRGGDRK